MFVMHGQMGKIAKLLLLSQKLSLEVSWSSFQLNDQLICLLTT